jgi:ABC-type polysaccharide/polyol phosphate export permease
MLYCCSVQRRPIGNWWWILQPAIARCSCTILFQMQFTAGMASKHCFSVLANGGTNHGIGQLTHSLLQRVVNDKL